MTRTRPDFRSWGWDVVLGLAALASVLPFWLVRYPPVQDLPQHLALMSIVRHYDDPSFHVREYFVLTFGSSQYALYYLLGTGLARVLGSVELANLTLLSSIGFGYAFGMRAILRATGGDPRAALFGPILFFNMTVFLGFFNYSAAFVVSLFAFALLAKHLEAPTRLRAVLLAVTGIFVFELHLSTWTHWVAVCGLVVLLKLRPLGPPERRRLLVSTATWILPSVIVAAVWTVASRTTRILPESGPGRGALFRSIPESIAHLPESLWNLWRDRADGYLAVAAFALMALVFVVTLRGADLRRELLRARLPLAAAGAATALYFGMPHVVAWSAYLGSRFAPVAVVLALCTIPRRETRAATLSFALVAFLAFGAAIVHAQHFFAFDREAAPFTTIIDQIPAGKRVLHIAFSHESAIRRDGAYVHFGAYQEARRGGLVAQTFAEFPHMPVRLRRSARVPQHDIGWEWRPCGYRNTHDGLYYEYILTRDPYRIFPLARMPGPIWSEVAHAGPWRLLHKTSVSLPGEDEDGPCTSGLWYPHADDAAHVAR